MTVKRRKIWVQGIVQGVGFRPFVYREATALGLTGTVMNTSRGVFIEVEGEDAALHNFMQRLENNAPPFSQIIDIDVSEIGVNNDTEFCIIKSTEDEGADTLISPDIAMCDDCLADISDPNNRRHGYAFTNCTNCGPRYTIIEGVPYDRPKTAMKGFKMCPDCLREYEDPRDRRYHAQPNACPVCGPTLSDDIRRTIEFLSQGRIVAIKGLGGFHLSVDATNNDAVLELRKRKFRDEKPFAVMMKDVETVRQYCEMSEEEDKILTSAQRPIVLLRKKGLGSKVLGTGGEIANDVAPGNAYLGVMLPYTPLHHILFTTAPSPYRPIALVMTSANLSDEPICYKNDDALERLKNIADHFLMHDRDIYIRTDDSITRVMNGKPLMLRRARGYVPQPIMLNTGDPSPSAQDDILAVGGELKNAVCLLKNGKAFLSQHIGDLENTASFGSFEMTIEHLKKLFDINPTVIAHDIHPEYFSTKWALGSPSPSPSPLGRGTLIPVQHHHAHIASCMAENRIDTPVIGIALDGTGYGSDGNIWGGEILVADLKKFERVGQFEYLPLPGGDAAAKNPWQMALSYVRTIGRSGDCEGIKKMMPAFVNIPDEKIELVLRMIDKKINSPLTSSCGRLFDAVAAIIGLKLSNAYEGQAALLLEMEASKSHDGAISYSYDLLRNNDYITISYTPTIKAILEDIKNSVQMPDIAMNFHNTVIKALTEATKETRRTKNINAVALSGGCFQNVLLAEGLKKSLENDGFNVYTHSLVPPNDGGIALGQAVIAQNSCHPREGGYL